MTPRPRTTGPGTIRRARRTARGVLALSRRRLQGRDVVVLASALTFFAAVAVVPLLLLAIALTAAVTSRERVAELSTHLVDALPGALGAGAVVDELVAAGLGLGVLGGALAVLPTTVYGEGLRRVLLRLQGPHASGGRDGGSRWRGRVSVLPLVLLTPILLHPLLLATEQVDALQQRGGASVLLGGVLGYYAVLLVLLVPVGWTFRVVASGRVRVRPLLVGAFLTAASLAGFLQGFVLFLALPLQLGAPFGGLTVVGGTVAVGLWLFLLNLVLLLGWVLTLALQQRWHPTGSAVRAAGADGTIDVMAHAYRKGSTVTWSWGNGTGEGKVVEVHTEKVTRTLKGSEITRNGSDDCPAYLVETSDGDQVLKLESELEKA